MQGTLFIVSTPIGNLGDITLRAISTLRDVDFIAAEDTRITAKLLNHLEIKKEQISYYRHNMDRQGRNILDRIQAGENCALCCDAGTPAVSDPGELLVALAIERGITVVPIPGPCAAITALSVSGLSSGRFCFEGFLPMSRKNRLSRISALQKESRTMVFYEAPHKLRNTLSDLCESFGAQRPVTLAREMTKIYEEILRTTLGEACELYSQRAPKGEYVLIVAGAQPSEKISYDEQLVIQSILDSTAEGMSLSDACRQASLEYGMSRNELYRLVTQQKNSCGSEDP